MIMIYLCFQLINYHNLKQFMLQKSYRILFRQLSHGFCKDKIKNDNDDPLATELQEQKIEQKKTQMKSIKKKETRRQFNMQKESKDSETQVGINWAEIQINKSSPNYKHHQSFLNSENFNNLYKTKSLGSKIKDLLKNIQNPRSCETLQQFMAHYIVTEPHDSYNLFIQEIVKLSPKGLQAIKSINTICYLLINSLIENSQKSKIIEVLTLLREKQHKHGGHLQFHSKEQIVTTFQLLSQIQCNKASMFQKYQIISLYFGSILIAPDDLQLKNCLIPINQKILADFNRRIVSQQQISTKEKQYFEQFFFQMIKIKCFKQSLIQQNTFYNVLCACYFGQVKNQNRFYERFFSIFRQISASVYSVDDYLKDFYINFYKCVQNYRLKSTDCNQAALPVSKILLENYQKAFEEQNKQIALICVAISFDNNYLDIPEHFFKYQSQGFTNNFNQGTLKIVKEQLSFRKLIKMKNNVNIQKIKRSSQFQFLQSVKRPASKLYFHIALGQYQEAFQFYQKQYFDKARIQKEREKIKYVLNQYINSSKLVLNIGEITTRRIIDKYVEHKIDDDYLRESWRKNQDLGQLLESYYGVSTQPAQLEETEGKQSQGSNKREIRFSYWEEYFLNKRALDLHRIESIGAIEDMEQYEKQPATSSHFNLNQYRNSEEIRQKYWERGSRQAQRIDQLKIYLYRLEYLLNEIEEAGVQKTAERINKYERALSEQNIKHLEEFGIIGYDVRYYDINELRNRIKSFYRYRGIIRDQKTLISPYQTLSDMTRKQRAFIKFSRQARAIQNQLKDEEESIQENLQQAVEQVEAANETTEEFIEQLPENLASKEKENYFDNVVKQQEEEEETIQVGHPQQTKIKDILISKKGAYRLSKQLIDLLRVKDRKAFSDAEYYTKVDKEQPFINQLIRWGLLYRQPMAIYMAEKWAVALGQKIPHYLAIRVSDFLSYHREIDQDIINQCKRCLEVIGPIKRQVIYDANNYYHHVHYKSLFSSQYNNLRNDIKQKLQDVLLVNHNLVESQQYSQKQKRLLKSQPLTI